MFSVNINSNNTSVEFNNLCLPYEILVTKLDLLLNAVCVLFRAVVIEYTLALNNWHKNTEYICTGQGHWQVLETYKMLVETHCTHTRLCTHKHTMHGNNITLLSG